MRGNSFFWLLSVVRHDSDTAIHSIEHAQDWQYVRSFSPGSPPSYTDAGVGAAVGAPVEQLVKSRV